MSADVLYAGRPDALYYARHLHGSDSLRGAVMLAAAAAWLFYLENAAERHAAKSDMVDIFYTVGVLVFAIGFCRFASFGYGFLKARFQTYRIYRDRVEIRDVLPLPHVRTYRIADLDPSFEMTEDRGHWSWVFDASTETLANTLFYARKDAGLFGVDKAALEVIAGLRDAAADAP